MKQLEKKFIRHDSRRLTCSVSLAGLLWLPCVLPALCSDRMGVVVAVRAIVPMDSISTEPVFWALGCRVFCHGESARGDRCMLDCVLALSSPPYKCALPLPLPLLLVLLRCAFVGGRMCTSMRTSSCVFCCCCRGCCGCCGWLGSDCT